LQRRITLLFFQYTFNLPKTKSIVNVFATKKPR
jgi:hypothetical protein